MLRLCWATKCFCFYLYGRKFLVRTYRAALTFLNKFADNNSRLMTWSLRLSEFYFCVQHTSVSKVTHVDELSELTQEASAESQPSTRCRHSNCRQGNSSHTQIQILRRGIQTIRLLDHHSLCVNSSNPSGSTTLGAEHGCSN